MVRGLFIADWKVDASELAEASARRLVVRSGGLLFSTKTSEMDQLVIDSNARSPNRTAARDSGYALVLRCPAHPLPSVARVLGRSRLAQVLSAVVETVAILVVNVFRRVRVQEPTVKPHLDAKLFADRVLSSRLRMAIEIPEVSRHTHSILDVDLRERALRKRHEVHARFYVRGGSTRLRSSGANSAARSTPVLHGCAYARRRTARSSPSSALFAADATQMYTRHCSPLLSRSSRAPVARTTRGYFSIVHHVTTLTGRVGAVSQCVAS